MGILYILKLVIGLLRYVVLSCGSRVFQIYDINKVARAAGMSPGAFVLGAGTGPRHAVGANCEVSKHG